MSKILKQTIHTRKKKKSPTKKAQHINLLPMSAERNDVKNPIIIHVNQNVHKYFRLQTK